MAEITFRRKIMEQLVQWKEESAGKTALLIDGARRVGKTYVVQEFAKKYYKSFLLIDFNRAGSRVREYFDDLNDLDSLFMLLAAEYHVDLYEHESLIIFDEVQLFPRARAAIKFLVADGRYHYIETGSLISIRENVQDIVIPSEEHHIQMYPMDFEEFLWAFGERPLAEVIRMNFERHREMGQALHRRAMLLFRQYMLVGGMPQAVETYLETKRFDRADAMKRDILSIYRHDITRHAKGYEKKVESVFDEIPAQLSRHEKKFVLASLGRGSRFRDYERAFLWLEDSMICNVCYSSTEPTVGIRLNRDRNTLKLYMGDTGLLVSLSFDENKQVPEEVYRKLLLDKLEVNEGMLFENIVAQMLTASGHRLYFYSNSSRNDKDSRMEIDFLITKSIVTSRHSVSPIEVKLGKNNAFLSLNKFMKKYHEQLDVPYVIYTGDQMEKDGVRYLPAYMAWLL